MFGEKFIFKSPKNINRRKKEEPKLISRRNFLKLSSVAAGCLALKNLDGVEKALDFLEKEGESDAAKDGHKPELIFASKDPDIEAVNKVLDFFSDEPIVINAETIKKTEDYWRVRYMADIDLADSLVGAKYEIEWWTDDLEKIFAAGGDEKAVAELLKKYPGMNLDTAQGRKAYVEKKQAEEGAVVKKEKKRDLDGGIVPVKYMYLAIPESHWQFGKNAVSSAKAAGPYQFTPGTARLFNLKINERDNPLKSAGACARHLLSDYKRFKDWDMALSSYNGGFSNRYRRECLKRGASCNYEGFMKYLSREANSIREEIRKRKTFKYKTGRKIKLSDLALKFGTSEKEIRRVNGNKLKGEWLGAGAKISIPNKKEDLLKMFRDKIKGISENLNYPPKLNAVLGLIEKGVG